MLNSNLLLDERGTPALRHVIGMLLRSATRADIAVSHVRLAALDLSGDEIANVKWCRILLGRLDADSLSGLSAGPGAQRQLERLLRFVTSGRVRIRSAGMAAWNPDFSVYTGMMPNDVARRDACLVGSHWFHQPVVENGPSLTCLLTDPAAVRVATERFTDLWARGHDVLPAVAATIEDALGRCAGGAVQETWSSST